MLAVYCFLRRNTKRVEERAIVTTTGECNEKMQTTQQMAVVRVIDGVEIVFRFLFFFLLLINIM